MRVIAARLPSLASRSDGARRRVRARRAPASRPPRCSAGSSAISSSRMHALHRDQHPPWREMARPSRGERREIRKRARDHDVEGRVGLQVLDARRLRGDVAQARARSRLASGTPPSCDWCRPASRCQSGRAIASGSPGRRRRSRRRARATCRARQLRQHGERVEQMMRDHALGLADRRQVVRPGSTWRAARDRRADCARCAARSSDTAERPARPASEIGRACAHRADRGVMRERASRHSGARPRSPRFRWTSNSEIAAGVMPGDARGLADRFRLVRVQFLLRLGRQSAHVAIVEIRRKAQCLPARAGVSISSCWRSM